MEDSSFDFDKLISFLLLALIIYFFRSVNMRIRRVIDQWALDNGMTVLSKTYIPWHWYFPLCGGFHPAKFEVKVINSYGKKETYRIAGGGWFGLNDNLEIQRIRNEKIEEEKSKNYGLK